MIYRGFEVVAVVADVLGTRAPLCKLRALVAYRPAATQVKLTRRQRAAEYENIPLPHNLT